VIGRFDAVESLVSIARQLGVARARVAAAGLQVVPYGGFPRAIETLGLIAAGLDDTPAGEPLPTPSPRSPDDIRADGRATFQRIYGEKTEDVLAQLEALHPELANHVLDAAYGRILASPALPLGERELLAVAALALAALPAPLGSHIRGALRNGFTPAAVEDILHASSSLADDCALPVIQQALDRLSRKVYRP
jgi:4-carboxymuconolactone decarboxylase